MVDDRTESGAGGSADTTRHRTGDGSTGGSRARRRTVGRRAAVTALVTGLAGCLGLDGGAGGDGGDSDDTDTDTTEPTTDVAGTDDATETTDMTPTTTDPVFPSYETTTVRVESPNGEERGVVDAAIADTGSLRYTGLSDTPSMPADRGMLFVYGEAGRRTYVMREMDFPLDMIFVDGDREITVVHEAPAPDPGQDGNDIRRTGLAQYVLEVNRGWSAERGVGPGDRLVFELP